MNDLNELKKYIQDVKDFPIKGIVFKDISPLLANGEIFRIVVEKMAEKVREVDVIIGPDARGFIFGAAVASYLKKPFVMIRKEGKLPHNTIKIDYKLEYGMGSLEIQKDLIKPGQSVAILDDVLATGGTTKASVELVKKLGAKVTKAVFLMELEFLNGKEKINAEVISLLKY
ncbi:adenine phosphoribosyltransferase [[Mycoplasma] mobile]|uniref:Adenine phosphoribosyltransferase n=1 Tax=Mycoplasma mobile (strain ATCC 43663 / 163K / NCTC 11711) TaxID=267748 RepID=APT_MYCM1|nr:adenine phosphoribosyltransferase [[Mycoplasma] mobile]Q6KI92.1 RecName: Full=Adenine phosphoribosyltransferase; Short=APRT [Mycoplasma mobile 163K]AAT27684.1 adenine phosphoribosyltransferase [Mycoplasma mobile 163K]